MANAARAETITVGNGRRVAFYVRPGRDDGRTVVFCHSAPGSGNFDPDPDATIARGVTLIGVDRPGYGRSDPMAADRWASVASAADDVVAVVASVVRPAHGTKTVGLAGWSAGGRVALAVAARRPDLVDRVAAIATPAPNDAVPWIPPGYQAALDALRDQPVAQVHAALSEQLSTAPPPDDRLALLGAGDADSDALAHPGARERLLAMLDTAFNQGVTGAATDLAGYCLRPWGFDPSEVAAKTLLLNGSSDPIAGPRHGKWWQRSLPNARFEQVPGAGHLVVIPLWARTLAHLAPARRAI